MNGTKIVTLKWVSMTSMYINLVGPIVEVLYPNSWSRQRGKKENFKNKGNILIILIFLMN